MAWAFEAKQKDYVQEEWVFELPLPTLTSTGEVAQRWTQVHQQKEKHLGQARQPRTAKLSPIRLRPSAEVQELSEEQGVKDGGRGRGRRGRRK